MALPNPKLPADASRPPIGSIVWTVALNAVVPVLLYEAARRYGSLSDYAALAVAGRTPFP